METCTHRVKHEGKGSGISEMRWRTQYLKRSHNEEQSDTLSVMQEGVWVLKMNTQSIHI